MRFQGTLIRWNEERGFGFIRVTPGNQEIFVHVSGFARDVTRPKVGEMLTFELENAPDGRKRAVHVRRPERAATPRPVGRADRPKARVGLTWRVLLIALLVGAGALGWRMFATGMGADLLPHGATPEVQAGQSTRVPEQTFRCDGRTRCSQMTSCEEAKYFLRTCPGVEMDGDHDGVPCEQQWCTSASD